MSRPVLPDADGPGSVAGKRALAARLLRERRERARDQPLSFAQARLWFLARLEPESPAYHLPSALRLRGRLDRRALAHALAGVARRHEVLRTTFPLVDGQPVQRVGDVGPAVLPVADLRALPPPARERELGRRVRAEAVRPFDLERRPPLRASLLRLGDEEWVLLATLHHVASDGWSMGILVREVSELYAARREGRAPALPRLPLQYADFAAWQRGWMRGEALERELGFWRGHLAGAPALLALPTDRPRPAAQDARGGTRRLALGAELSAALRALARREGATLFTVLLAGWQLLLGRYAGEDGVVVGTPVAGRTRVELEPLIGFFANTLALRADLSGEPTFRELLARARRTVVDALAHQDAPFERVVDALGVGRSLAHAPLVQVMVSLQNAGPGELRLGDLRVEPVPTASGRVMFDLALDVTELDGGLEALLTYRAELWDDATAGRMLEHWRTLLAAAAADPGLLAADLPLLSAAESARLRVEGNATAAPYPRDACAHALIAAHAAASPGAVALAWEGGALSYGELDRRANRLARHLRALGVGPEARVGVCLERGPDLLAAVLGVLKAGGAYVPLDPAYPAARLARALADSGARVLVTLAALGDRVPGDATTVSLDGDAAAIALHPPTDPRAPVEAGNAAYVVYTSGSSGEPKGVVATHRSLVAYVHALRGLTGLTAADRGAHFVSVGFDVGVEEVFLTLTAGASLALVREDLLDAPAFLERCGRRGVTFLTLPTAYWHEVVAALEGGAARLPASLRTVLIGGEAARPGAVNAWNHLAGGVRLLNGYGPTETTIASTFQELTGAELDPRRPVPIGRPIANGRACVLDPRGAPVPVGVPGELYLGGEGVARGYLGRPGLTAARFLPDPHAAAPGARRYRTGDRARWLEGGTLEFLGRVDRQLKVRGFRVEPGEVEAALAACPGVREAAVVLRHDAAGHPRLAAYLTAHGAAPDPAAVRAFLRERLPEPMVPAVIVPLDALPLLPNGKLDRAALPPLDPVAAGGAHAPPRTATELAVAAVWREVLAVEGPGLHDGFFDLGGDSLLLVRAHAALQARLGRPIPLSELLRHPTLEALAAALDHGPAPDPSARAEGEARAAGRRALSGLRRARVELRRGEGTGGDE